MNHAAFNTQAPNSRGLFWAKLPKTLDDSVVAKPPNLVTAAQHGRQWRRV